MLFHIESSESTDEVSEVAIRAAINLVKLSAQQVVYIAGKGVLQEEYQKFKVRACMNYVTRQRVSGPHLYW